MTGPNHFAKRLYDQMAQLVNDLDHVFYNIDEVTWPPQHADTLTKSKHFSFSL